jgi:catechol 2,3-dioxygenase-like lactoylglutathione lyase family enzyme
MSTRMDKKPETGVRSEPQTLRLRSLGISLTCSDFQKSLAFYRDILGFHVDRTYPEGRGAAIVAGDVRISLNQDDWKKGKDRKKGLGMRIYLNTGQDIDEVAARIRKAGGKLDDDPADRPWGVRSFSITDPDGFGLTFSKPLDG